MTAPGRFCDIALLLINNGADVNAKDKHDRNKTPLHHAVARGTVRVAKLLLDHGADINAKDEVFLVLDDVALEQLRREILTAFERGIQVGALLTGNGELQCGQVAYHPPAESELQGLGNTLTIVVDNKECMIADLSLDMVATITTNRNLVLISRQFIWMELFAQRIYRRLNPAMLDLLDESDRHIFQSISTRE